MNDEIPEDLDENLEVAAPVAAVDPFALQRQRVADAGGFMIELEHHILTYLPGRGERLVVSFDNLAAVREIEDRVIWGQKFLTAQGFDILGLQIKRRDWYRDAALIETLERLRDEGFFARFPQVSMYGASMGAYGALAFAPLAPGCSVMAFAPQRSLALDLAPFETRYRYARNTCDWSLPYGDAAEGLKAARRVYIGYDPILSEDRLHAESLRADHVTLLKMPHLGHKLPPALLKMGLLKPISLAAFEGSLEMAAFHQMMRARRDSMPWKVDLLARAKARGHLDLGLRLAEKLMSEQPHWKLRHARKELRMAIKAR